MRMGIGLGIGINRSNYAQGIFGAYQSRVVADGGVTEAGGCVDAGATPLLQTASLLLIPSGYKALKLYSEIPTNGNGDFTWARTSTANRTNSSGNIELMATGVPRLSYMYGSCPSVLLEPQRTNIVFPSEDFSTTWSAINTTVTTNQATAPDGNLTADRISITSNAGYIRRFSLTTANSSTYTASVYVKNDTISAGNTFNFYFNNNLGSPNSAECIAIININSGTVTSSSSGLGISNVSASIQSLINGWYRINLTFTLGALAGNNNCEIGFSAPTATRTFFAWGAQLEAGAYPTTYIPTTSATATRVADSFSQNSIYTNNFITSSGGTWFFELDNNISLIRDAASNLFIGTTNNGNTNTSLGIRTNGATAQRLAIYKRISGTLTQLYLTLTDTIKVAIKWNGTTADVFVNGVKVNSATAFTTTNMEFLQGDGNDVPKFIQQMALCKTPLTDTQCQELTT